MSENDLYEPAGFSGTASSEQRSADILQYHLDRRFVYGVPNTSDKKPNSDGLLTITDGRGIPTGYIDIQLKTMQPAHYKKPRFACERKLLAYASGSQLPVILIAVDQLNEKPYWLYLDPAPVKDWQKKGRGKTVTIAIPPENIICRGNTDYIAEWTKIVLHRQEKIQLYDQVTAQLNGLRQQLGELSPHFQPAFSLSGQDIREIHLFLDYYNGLLDKEFRAIKDILFYNYWKIGIGLVEYQPTGTRYFLLPQSYNSNAPLIKELKKEEPIIEFDFFQQGALSFHSNGESNHISTEPKRTAFRAAESDVKKVVGKTNFAIGNSFVAREYLSSFLDSFGVYLGIEQNWDNFPIKRLSDLLFVIMPVVIEQHTNFAPHVSDFLSYIDNHKDEPLKPHFAAHIAAAEASLAEGYIPAVRVSLTSQLFDFNLLIYYMDWLENHQEKEIKRVYVPGLTTGSPNGQAWRSWKKEALQRNLVLFFQHFPVVYKQLLQQQFSVLQPRLDLFRNCDLIFYMLLFSDKQEHKPCLCFYKLKARQPVTPRIQYFTDETDCPISRKVIYEENCWVFTIDGVTYDLLVSGNHPLAFMYNRTPTYALINEELEIAIKEFFDQEFSNMSN